MELENKLVAETLALSFSLTGLGINPIFMHAALPDTNPIHSVEAVHLLFNYVHLDTQSGQKPLPPLPEHPQSFYKINQIIQKQLEKEGKVPNPLIEEALHKYSTDLNFRSELYALYTTFVLPTIRNLRNAQ
jgi:hypothetical protein